MSKYGDGPLLDAPACSLPIDQQDALRTALRLIGEARAIVKDIDERTRLVKNRQPSLGRARARLNWAIGDIDDVLGIRT